MKRFYLLLLICLTALYSKGQDTTLKKNRLTESVKEKYSVLKNDNNYRQGSYRAYFLNKTVIASGTYQANEKSGIWHFYDIWGRLVEVFDYSNNRLLDEEKIDYVSRQHISYSFDRDLNDTDKLTKPIRVGGRCFGYIPYLQLFHLPIDNSIDARMLNLKAVMELLISPGGRLADLKIHIMAANTSDRITTFSPDIFSNDDRQFIPATLNGKPVISRIFLLCSITADGGLDVD